MELKEFISESLCQIAEAVAEAKKKTKENDCIINPYINERFENLNQNSEYVGYAQGERLIQIVKFDIAVTIERSKEKRGEIQVVASGLNAGFSLSRKKSENTVSRLNFSIPVSLPIEYIK